MSDFLGLSAIVILLYIAHQLSRVFQQNQWTQLQLSKLLENQGIELGHILEPSPAVKELARKPGSEIEAIRAYRLQTGVGLKEAQAVVQAISRTNPSEA